MWKKEKLREKDVNIGIMKRKNILVKVLHLKLWKSKIVMEKLNNSLNVKLLT